MEFDSGTVDAIPDAALVARVAGDIDHRESEQRDEGDRGKLRALIEGTGFMSIDVDGGSSTGTVPTIADIEAGEEP